jgi:hypothetical protein
MVVKGLFVAFSCLFAYVISASTGWIFVKCHTGDFYENLLRNLKSGENQTKISATLHAYQSTCLFLTAVRIISWLENSAHWNHCYILTASFDNFILWTVTFKSTTILNSLLRYHGNSGHKNLLQYFLRPAWSVMLIEVADYSVANLGYRLGQGRRLFLFWHTHRSVLRRFQSPVLCLLVTLHQEIRLQGHRLP